MTQDKRIILPYVQDGITYFSLIEDLGREKILFEIRRAITFGLPIISFMKPGWIKPVRMELKITDDAIWAYWMIE